MSEETKEFNELVEMYMKCEKKTLAELLAIKSIGDKHEANETCEKGKTDGNENDGILVNDWPTIKDYDLPKPAQQNPWGWWCSGNCTYCTRLYCRYRHEPIVYTISTTGTSGEEFNSNFSTLS